MAKLGWLGLPFPRSRAAPGSAWSSCAWCWKSWGARRTRARTSPASSSAGSGSMLGGQRRAEGEVALRHRRGQRARQRRAARGRARLGSRVDEATATRAGDGWALSGVKRFVPWAHVADVVLVPARSPEGLTLFLVDPKQAGVTLKPMVGIDLANRWSQMRLDKARGGGGRRRRPARRRRARARVAAAPGRRLRLGRDAGCGAPLPRHERRATSRCASSSASSSARSRPSATAAPRCCWRSKTRTPPSTTRRGRSRRAPRTPRVAASICKSYVSDAARKVCGDAIQVHGGIGFTWEYDLHLYMKRAKALEPLYGDAEFHRELIVRHVAMQSNRAPPRPRRSPACGSSTSRPTSPAPTAP